MKIHLLLLLFSLGKFTLGQNLIANPKFIDLNICKEFNAKCGPEGWFMASNSVPIGKNMAGITVFNSSKKNVRQYLQTELLLPLEKDSVYEINITLLAGDCILSELGVKFYSDVVCLEKQELIEHADIDFSSQISTLSKHQQKKELNLTYQYKAKGGERFILIGSFVSDKNQKRKYLVKEKQYENYLYFIKKVEVNAPYLDILPQSCENVKHHLYDYNYRHTNCMYHPYQKQNNIQTNIFDETANQVKVDSIVLGGVLFGFNSSELKTVAKTILLSYIKGIDKNKLKNIQIYGHTDNVGDVTYNQILSLKRAESVKQFLIDNGFSKTYFEVFGKGKSKPIADNTTEIGREKNRRIEILFVYE